MDRDQAKGVVKEALAQYLEQTGRPLNKPFHCLNPDHNDNKPSMSYDKKRQKVHCFSCNADYDTFDLIGIDYNLTGNDVFKKGFEFFGLNVDPYHTTAAEDFRQPAQQKTSNQAYTTAPTPKKNSSSGALDWDTEIGKAEPAKVYDFTDKIEEAHKLLLQTPAALGYFRSRGITPETIKAFKLGLAPEGYNALLQDYPELQTKSRKAGLYNYLYPIFDKAGRCRYFLTEISDRAQVDSYNGKYRKINGIPAQFFNSQYLEREGAPETVYICEGVFDALSIEQLGGKAIALTGTAGNKLKEIIGHNKPDTVYIIALDSDEAGQKAAHDLQEKLQELGALCFIGQLEGRKDANDLLRQDPQALENFIAGTSEEARKLRYEEEERQRAEYLATSAASQLQSFINDIRDSKKAVYYSTGFPSLDQILDGGLYAGLYCIGAISSLGKTTFCLQVADTIAASGVDVLIFSLEMARNELIAKSVSRHTLLEDLAQNNSTKQAKTTRGILTGSRYQYYNKDEKGLIERAITAYSKYADHIFINVGIGDIGINEIREAVEKHVKLTGRTPAIIIDYLQIIAPADPRSTDKQNTDKAVLEMKRISRDFSTPVIGISSFNRDNYHAPVNLASFKESGAIEYSSDVLIGLQYAGMDYQEGEAEKAREKRVRELLNANIRKGKEGQALQIEVKVLKNRNGSKGACMLDFYPMFNYFVENANANAAAEAKAEFSPFTGSTRAEQANEAPKISKREQQRQALVDAFFKAEDQENKGTANLETMADVMQLSKRAIKGQLSEFKACFTVDKELVTYSKADKDRALYSEEFDLL